MADRRSMADLMAAQQAESGGLAGGLAALAPSTDLAVIEPTSVSQIWDTRPAEVPEGPLSDAERQQLTRYERTVGNAFIEAGRALGFIREHGLYREYGTFEEYLKARWRMSRSDAYRKIDAVPVAEAMSQIWDTLTESHVQVLVPLSRKHGPQAAAVVYQAVSEGAEGQVTAALLREAAAVLPGDHFDAYEAARLIRAYLGDRTPPDPAPAGPAVPDPGKSFPARVAAEVVRMYHVADGAGRDDVLYAAAQFRAAADELERGAG